MIKKSKKTLHFLLLLIIIFPLNIMAYSKYIYAGGSSIGIELNTNGVLIVGTYSINNINTAKKSGLKPGDKIVKVDGNKITSIADLTKNVQGKNEVKLEYIRDNNTKETTLKIVLEDGFYKTGLYVKDSMMGIGTLTYVDPGTNIYGCLGHEIIEKTTNDIFKAIDGTIFSSSITNIIKSKNGYPGEKVAKFNPDSIYGTVAENTKKGIFGKYTDIIPNKKLFKVATSDEIKLGQASILTVISNNEIEEFSINILKVFDNSLTKNILFEINDPKLLKKTNGIVQGMSGSPIIQGDNIIGAVTHVVVENPLKGYGIFITNMLEEGEN